MSVKLFGRNCKSSTNSLAGQGLKSNAHVESLLTGDANSHKSFIFQRMYIYNIRQMCLALAKIIPLIELQDDTCTKTIHNIRQMCLAMAKYTTGRAPRQHVYQDYT